MAIVALGMALVISTGGIDLSVGSVMAIAGQVGALLIVLGGVATVLAVLLALVVARRAGCSTAPSWSASASSRSSPR